MSTFNPASSVKFDPFDLKALETNPNQGEEDHSEWLSRAVLKQSRFRANDASKKLFESCVGPNTFDSPFYRSEGSNPCSPLPPKQVDPETTYSLFTSRIKGTPLPLFTLPPPKKDSLAQRLSDKEFSKRKDLCRHEKSVANFFAGPYSPHTPCLSLKKGMDDKQEEEFNEHIQKVNQEVHFRMATAPFTAIGATSRKAAVPAKERREENLYQVNI